MKYSHKNKTGANKTKGDIIIKCRRHYNTPTFLFNRLPYFLSARWPVLKLIIRQCRGAKGLKVKIVSFMFFFRNCSFY